LEVLICRDIGIVIIIPIFIIITWDILVTLSGTKREEFAEKKNKMWGTSGDWYWVQRMTRLAVWPEWIWINVARSGECMCGQNDQ